MPEFSVWIIRYNRAVFKYENILRSKNPVPVSAYVSALWTFAYFQDKPAFWQICDDYIITWLQATAFYGIVALVFDYNLNAKA